MLLESFSASSGGFIDISFIGSLMKGIDLS